MNKLRTITTNDAGVLDAFLFSFDKIVITVHSNSGFQDSGEGCYNIYQLDPNTPNKVYKIVFSSNATEIQMALNFPGYFLIFISNIFKDTINLLRSGLQFPFAGLHEASSVVFKSNQCADRLKKDNNLNLNISKRSILKNTLHMLGFRYTDANESMNNLD